MRRMPVWCCLLLTLGVAWTISPTAKADDETPLSRIAFGSCAKQNRPQPIWEAVVGTEPDVFLFIGDNIYGDTEDMDVLRAKWDKLGAQPGYQKLKRTCRVLATWDDHDYGANDAGREYPRKRESQQIFLDFFDEPTDSARRRTEGVYDAETFGPPGKRVQIILLDTRYFRSPLVSKEWDTEPGDGYHGIYAPNPDPEATMLGPTQWNWLEKQLRKPAKLRIIASSIQVVSNEHGWEKWGNLPHERARLFGMIRSTGAEGVVFISGDRHRAEISRIDAHAGYPLYDVTSSSLNQPGKFRNEINRHRVGLLYHESNFGTISVDWDADDPVVRLQVRGMDGDVVLQQKLRLSELRSHHPR